MSIPTYKDRMDVLSKIVCFYKTTNKGGDNPVSASGYIKYYMLQTSSNLSFTSSIHLGSLIFASSISFSGISL